MDTRALKASLYRAAHTPRYADELALAATAWFEGVAQEDPEAGPGAPAAWLDFLDFFVLEWVDAEGLTAIERELGVPLPAPLLAWILKARAGIFAVSAWEDGWAEAHAEDGALLNIRVAEPLERRAVIAGRLLPAGRGGWVPTGAPDLYEPMRVIQRLELVKAWAESPRRALLERLSGLRRAFVTQREQREAFVAHFGSDALVFETPAELARSLNTFIERLEHEIPLASLGGRTRAQALRDRGEAPFTVQVELGPSLAESHRIGVIYDPMEGIHLLPSYGDFLDHLGGIAEHPRVVRGYLEEPGISALPFRRAARTDRLAALLGVADAPLEVLLAPFKDLSARTAPSVLAGLEG